MIIKLNILPRDLLEFYTIAQKDKKLIQYHYQAEYNIKSNFLAELTVQLEFWKLDFAWLHWSKAFQLFCSSNDKVLSLCENDTKPYFPQTVEII